MAPHALDAEPRVALHRIVGFDARDDVGDTGHDAWKVSLDGAGAQPELGSTAHVGGDARRSGSALCWVRSPC